MDRVVKRAGMHLGMEKLGVHPLEQMRNQAQYNIGNQNLLQTLGYGPQDEMQALAQNGSYYNQLQQLYDKHFAPAAERPTKVLSVTE